MDSNNQTKPSKRNPKLPRAANKEAVQIAMKSL
jgi:hypothetical protein